MIYDLDRQEIVVTWEDGPFDGLEIRSKTPSVGCVLSMAELGFVDWDRLTRDDLWAVRACLRDVGDCLLAWTLQEGGVAVPAGAAGLESLEMSVALALVQAWYSAVREVMATRSEPADDGEEIEQAHRPGGFDESMLPAPVLLDPRTEEE